jgi:hypothetical protein
VRRRPDGRLTACDLPLHQLCKRALFIGCELSVRSDLCDLAVGADADDNIAALDGAEAVRDRNGGVIALEQLGEGLVDEGLRFGVEG